MRWLIRSIITILVLIPVFMNVVNSHNLETENFQEDDSFLTNLERWAYDTRINILSPKTRDSEIVILDIDEKSLAAIGQWPWARDDIAQIVDVLFDYYQIDVLGFDITFPEADRSEDLELLNEIESKFAQEGKDSLLDFSAIRESRERDKILAKSFENRNVVLGFVLDNAERAPAGILPKYTFDYPDVQDKFYFYETDTYTGNLDVLQNSAFGAGNFHPLAVDGDGKIRRVPLLVSFGSKVYDSLSLAIVKAKMQSQVQFSFYSDQVQGYSTLESLNVGGLDIPVSEYMNMLVPYRGEQGSFEYISAVDILNKSKSEDALKNKIVIVGTTAAGLKDFRVTPVSEIYPGVEIHANLVSAMLTGNTLKTPDEQSAIQVVGLVILAVLMTLMMVHLPILISSIITLIVMLSIWFGNLYLWKQGTVIPVMPLIVFTGLTYLTHLIYGSFIESRNKQQLTKLFGQYVPPELVSEMEADLTHYTMETKQAELTVMFADIKGFTTLSEALNADQVAEVLNEFLTTMTELIHLKRGTIDKYMGDAIMAFWGAPLGDKKHAQHAVETAFLMQEKMQALNAKLNTRGLPNIDICIGINTGNMTVGNMGSEFRMAYTVIGDSVNLAARLEALTRIYDIRIMLGEQTRRALKNTLCLELDKVIVKGKEQAVTIYEPIGQVDNMSQEQAKMLEKHVQALTAYRSMNWAEAVRLFHELKQQFPEKSLFELFLQRIEVFIENPPPAHWNGVHKFTEK